jgi:hypothetical protein
MLTDGNLANLAQGVARRLTYNDDDAQAQAKQLLLECAHRLDSRDVRATMPATGGLLLTNGRGKQRYATLRERLAYRIAGTLPREI